MSITNLTSTQLRRAADLQDQIASLQKELAKITDPGSAIPAPFKATKPVKRKGMSAEGKARIAAAAKLRWAKVKAAKTAKTISKAVKPAKKKRTVTPEHIAKIKAGQKIRWAKFHAAQAKSGGKKK